MTSFTLWIRLKDNSAIDRCITHLGELYNSDKPYKNFPPHITLLPSISRKHQNMEKDEIIEIVQKSVKNVRKELGNGKKISFVVLDKQPDFLQIRWGLNFSHFAKVYRKSNI